MSALRDVALQVGGKLYPNDDVTAQNPALIGIIIELLPFLAELLGKNCAPDDAAGVAVLAKQGGLRGRWNRRFISRAIIRLHGRAGYRDLGGDAFYSHLAAVAGDTANAGSIEEIMEGGEAPEWSILGGMS